MTGFQNQAQSALYAADAGVAESIDILRTNTAGAAIAPGDCLATKLVSTDLGGGRSYEPDPDDDEICMLAASEPCLDTSVEVGSAVYRYSIWNVRVQGNAPGGAAARVQATVARCSAF